MEVEFHDVALHIVRVLGQWHDAVLATLLEGEICCDSPCIGWLHNHDLLASIVVFDLVFNLCHPHYYKAHMNPLLFVGRMQNWYESGIILSQYHADFNLLRERVFKGEDILLVLKPVHVFGMWEAMTGSPLIFKFNPEATVWKVSDYNDCVEHLNKVLNLHHKYSILYIPPMNIPLVLCVPV